MTSSTMLFYPMHTCATKLAMEGYANLFSEEKPRYSPESGPLLVCIAIMYMHSYSLETAWKRLIGCSSADIDIAS